MKKSKLLFAVLSATAIAASAGALVACGDEVELPNGTKVGGVREVTFSANGGVFGETASAIVKTDEKGHIITAPTEPVYDGYEFNGYNFKKDGAGEKITFGENGTVFLVDVTVYAQWTEKTEPGPGPGPGPGPVVTEEYKIMFHGGAHGTVTGETTGKTVNGKIAEFPAVEAEVGWIHSGWMLEDETPIDTTVAFNADVEVYAYYTPDPISVAKAVAVTNGDKAPMSDNSESIDKEKFPTLVKEYMLSEIVLAENQTVTFEIRDDDGELVALPGRLFVDKESAGIDISVTSSPVACMTALRAGTYAVYLKLWTSDDWTVYATDGGAPIVEEQTLVDGALYVVGGMTDWQLKEAYQIKDNTVEVKLTPDDWFKIGSCKLITDENTGKDKYELYWGPQGDDGAGTYELNWYQLDTASQALVEKDAGNSTNLKVKTEGTYVITVLGTAPSLTWTIALKGAGPVIIDPPERPTTDPNPPERAYEDADVKVGETTMTDATSSVDRTWKTDATKPEGGYYDNHTLSDQFMATLNITAETEYSFTIDGTALGEVWIEHHKDIQVKVGAALGAAGGASGASFTLAAGEYTLYLKKYSDGGFTVWIQGTQTGSFGETPVVETNTYKVGESGTAVDLTPKSLTAAETAEGMLAQYWIDTVQFNTGDKLYFTIKGQAIEFEVESSSSGVKTPDGTNNTYLEISKGGKFKIYIKYYETKYQIYAGREIDPSEITKTTETVTANNAYLVGNVQNSDATWDNSGSKGFKLTARTDGMYEIVIDMTAGDNFKFYKTGSTTSNKTWIGTIGSSGVSAYIAPSGDNLSIKADGKFYFIVDASAAKVYVSYSADGEPTAPKIEAPIEGGAYLVGQGFTNAQWSVSPSLYIDPVNGLEVKLTSTSQFKITDCKNGKEGWGYNSATYYECRDSDGNAFNGLKLNTISASGNGSVVTAGTYKITVEEKNGQKLFVFTYLGA